MSGAPHTHIWSFCFYLRFSEVEGFFFYDTIIVTKKGSPKNCGVRKNVP